MAKNGSKTLIAIISLVLTGAVIGTGVIVYAVTNTHETGDTAEGLDKLEKVGCYPARGNITSIAVIKSEMATAKGERAGIKADVEKMDKKIDAGFKEIDIRQRADTKTILKAIEDKL